MWPGVLRTCTGLSGLEHGRNLDRGRQAINTGWVGLLLRSTLSRMQCEGDSFPRLSCPHGTSGITPGARVREAEPAREPGPGRTGGARELVLDTELVAVDRGNGNRLRSFQELSTRARGDITAQQARAGAPAVLACHGD